MITFLVIIKKIDLKWAENILSRNKLAGKKNMIFKQNKNNICGCNKKCTRMEMN